MLIRTIGPLLTLAYTTVVTGAGIHILDTQIDPAPGQQVTVMATGSTAVQGVNLFVQTRPATLSFTGMSIVGGIFDPNNTGPYVEVTGGAMPAGYAAMSVTTASGTVSAPGILCVLTIDATGAAGTSVTITANTDEIASDWGGIPVDAFVDGTITVRGDQPPSPPVNQAPTVDAGPDQTVTSGAVVTLSGQASDPEGAPLTYAWSQVAGTVITLSNPSSAPASFTAPSVSQVTTLQLQLSVSDGTTSVDDTVSITVNPPGPPPVNQPPTIEAGSDQTVASGNTVSLAGQATDPEAAPLSCAWSQIAGTMVALSNPLSMTASFTAPSVSQATTLQFRFTVSDGVDPVSDDVSITVNPQAPPPVNQPPVVEAGANQTVTAGDMVTLDGQATDPENATLSYAWSQTAGTTVTLSSASAASVSFTAPSVSQTTTLQFQLSASDGTNSVSDTLDIRVNPSLPSLPPEPVVVDQTIPLSTDGNTTTADVGDATTTPATTILPPGAILAGFLVVLVILLWLLSIWL